MSQAGEQIGDILMARGIFRAVAGRLVAPLDAIIAAIKMSHAQRRGRVPPALSIAIAEHNDVDSQSDPFSIIIKRHRRSDVIAQVYLQVSEDGLFNAKQQTWNSDRLDHAAREHYYFTVDESIRLYRADIKLLSAVLRCLGSHDPTANY
ncbi:unnamed protein product [Leptidea sinapis]|uniref:Uncharacterized protein n=1 Tax=Leptidea sinapis TaxID=189913 RepID=A0A5E4QYR6_9NEOP|nr:unnamed protein product [Leptidea sinapis]